MRTTFTQWIIKLLQFELSYKTLRIATLIYFLVPFIAFLTCLYFFLFSVPGKDQLAIGSGYVVIKGINKIKRLKIKK